MLSPYRFQPNNTKKRTTKTSNTKIDNNSHPDLDVKRNRLNSNDLKPTSNESVKNKTNNLKVGANIDINDEYFDEVLYKNDFQLDLARQVISDDKTVRSDTVQDVREFNSQPLTTQAKKERTIGFYGTS